MSGSIYPYQSVSLSPSSQLVPSSSSCSFLTFPSNPMDSQHFLKPFTVTCRSTCRFSHLLTSFSRSIFYSWCSKLYHNNNQHKAKKHKTWTNSTICMINCNYRPVTTTVTTSPSRSNYSTTNRPQLKHIIFRPSRRGRPNPIPTFILIFWTPWSLYSHPTRIQYNLSHHLSWKREKGSFRKFRNNHMLL